MFYYGIIFINSSWKYSTVEANGLGLFSVEWCYEGGEALHKKNLFRTARPTMPSRTAKKARNDMLSKTSKRMKCICRETQRCMHEAHCKPVHCFSFRVLPKTNTLPTSAPFNEHGFLFPTHRLRFTARPNFLSTGAGYVIFLFSASPSSQHRQPFD